MKKNIILFAVAALALGSCVMWIDTPINDKTYFTYPNRTLSYDGGKIKFNVVNNGGQSSRSIFIRVAVFPGESDVFKTCQLSDFDWDFKNVAEREWLYSTSEANSVSTSATFKAFENKLDGMIFKGVSGGGLKPESLQISIDFKPDSTCGVSSDELSIETVMEVSKVRMTLWRRFFSQ